MVFRWSLSVSKSSQVSRTLNVLADLNSSVVWMIFTFPLISKSSSLCIIPLVSIPSVAIIIGIIITFMFHSLFSSLASLCY